jgi:uncharacterized membrane protein (DUF373 family)
VLRQVDEKLRTYSSQLLYLFEASLYVAVGFLLGGGALTVLIQACEVLWSGIMQRKLGGNALQVLDQLLLVLVLVEIMHTVRMSIRSREIIIEPFLIVGLIASVRRVLVITMQAAKMTEGGNVSADAGDAFHRSMLELGLLGVLVLVFVLAIVLLRRAHYHEALVKEEAA